MSESKQTGLLPDEEMPIEQPMEWEVLSANERYCYYLLWGHHEAVAFLVSLEAWNPTYADEYAEPDDVRHGHWRKFGGCAECADEPGYKQCAADAEGAREATWVFIDE